MVKQAPLECKTGTIATSKHIYHFLLRLFLQNHNESILLIKQYFAKTVAVLVLNDI